MTRSASPDKFSITQCPAAAVTLQDLLYVSPQHGQQLTAAQFRTAQIRVVQHSVFQPVTPKYDMCAEGCSTV